MRFLQQSIVPYELIEGCEILEENSTPAVGVISRISEILLIRKLWSTSDLRLFYVFQRDSEIWLTQEDKAVIHYFNDIFGITSKSYNSVNDCPISLDANISRNTDKIDGSDLLLEWTSRGTFSFHFGHFIIDVIPLLMAIHNTKTLSDYKLLISIFPAWASELLDLYGLKRLGTLLYVYNDVGGEELNRSKNIAFTKVENATFIKLSPGYRDNLLNNGFRVNELQYKPSMSRLAVLSRRCLPNSKPIRWINEDECIKACVNHQVLTLFPEELGPIELIRQLSAYRPGIILGCAGSALHQLLVISDITPLILMVASRLNPKTMWKSQLSDFKYARGKFSILSKITTANADWNDSFEISPEAFSYLIGKLSQEVCSNNYGQQVYEDFYLYSSM
jgi:hypothetical protein